MKNNLSSKKNCSAIQLLKTLLLLLENNYTMSELVEKLNANEKEPCFNNNVVSKYINTCRFCGIDIPKIQNKYYVLSLPFGLNFNSREITLFNKLQEVSNNGMSKKVNKIFEGFVDKISNFSNKKLAKVEKKSILFVQNVFDRALNEQRKLNLMYKNGKNLECAPIAITEINNKMFFKVYNNNREKIISMDKISGIELLPEKYYVNYEEKFDEQVVVYKLKGDLAKRYSIREHEILESKSANEITISNKGENREELLSRLLRYDSCCEIIYPNLYREDIIEIINETLKNYGVSQ